MTTQNNTNYENANFTPLSKFMDEDQFWKIIQTVNENSQENSQGDYELQYEELAKQLHTLTPDDIILFANRFMFFRGQANTWELWGAIYIIQGGCDEDSFKIFREWVIGQGNDFYYKITKDPDTLAELETEFIETTAEFEGLSRIISKVFKEITNQDIPYTFQENLSIAGVKWDEEGDDLKNRFPKIYSKYPYNI